MAKQEDGLDYTELADNVDELREMTRAIVAGLVADGFTPEQAREIATGIFRVMGRPNVSGNPDKKDGEQA